ncbi:hypothetical protein DFH05DRAFT_1539437 [Lentinula detonsa]|uniref:Survival Motor Neuron Gemin2-binding domain-containing protein n=1 Tax=Lentinula detonsa TaxID=2804962 RepID=A0A9W8U3B9_9AGAR|nr:hypothetical protein DFH05DRAFT_1539437 [Lentinula detonsa]
MRPVVSYDDITLPYESPSTVVQEASKVTSNKTSSSKKRKRKSRHSAAAASGNQGKPGQNRLNGTEDDEDADYLEVEESRELAHEEIWDDSALIEAWNAATEEYKAYHGPDKGWKNEPVHKSPLWYNTPPLPSKKQKTSHLLPPSILVGAATSVEAHNLNPDISASAGSDAAFESDSKPLDFNTFIPTHDAGLSIPVLPASQTLQEGSAGIDFSSHYATTVLSGNPGEMVSQDEAFKRALEATYWSGYWTAMYHSQNHKKHTEPSLTPGRRDDTAEETPNEDERGDEAANDAEMMDDDVQAILDINNDGNFEGDVDLVDGEGEEDGGETVIEAGKDEGEENDSLASSSGGDFVSTQR